MGGVSLFFPKNPKKLAAIDFQLTRKPKMPVYYVQCNKKLPMLENLQDLS